MPGIRTIIQVVRMIMNITMLTDQKEQLLLRAQLSIPFAG